jgi:hypothetical protein
LQKKIILTNKKNEKYLKKNNVKLKLKLKYNTANIFIKNRKKYNKKYYLYLFFYIFPK